MSYLVITDTGPNHVLLAEDCDALPSREDLEPRVQQLVGPSVRLYRTVGRYSGHWGTIVAEVTEMVNGALSTDGRMHVWYYVAPAPIEPAGKVIDLMEALKASLAAHAARDAGVTTNQNVQDQPTPEQPMAFAHPTHRGLAIRAVDVAAGRVPGINVHELAERHPDAEKPYHYAQSVDEATGLNWQHQPKVFRLSGATPAYVAFASPQLAGHPLNPAWASLGYRPGEWYWMPESVAGREWPQVWDASEAEAKEEPEGKTPLFEDAEVEIAKIFGARKADEPREPILQYFAHEHLPPKLGAVSAPFGALADVLVSELPRNPERTVALRKLLEAKDAAVRAALTPA